MARYHNRKETKRIGEQIKQLRIKQGWNIEDISAMTGFSRSTLSSIENGSDTNTTHLIEIAKAIGVHPNELFNIFFDLKPRYKLPEKRKDQQKLTFKLRSFAEAGFFNEPRLVNDVKQNLLENFKLKVSAAQISVLLMRLVSEGVLKSSKLGRKNLYSSKSKGK